MTSQLTEITQQTNHKLTAVTVSELHSSCDMYYCDKVLLRNVFKPKSELQCSCTILIFHNWICKIAARELQTVKCKGFDHTKLTVKFFFFFFTWNVIFARDISSLLVPGLGTIFSSTKRRLIWITWTSMSTVQDRQLKLITDSLPTKMINAAVFLPVFFCFNYWGSNLWILL